MAGPNPSSVQSEGVTIDNAHPLPATTVAAGTPGPDVVINPRTLVVNGEEVSPTNPFPLSLV